MTVLEKFGHFLDVENDRLAQIHRQLGYSEQQITPIIGEKMDIRSILAQSAADFDGGYALAGMIGHGDAFVLRDPSGIRPAFWYADDEVVVVASERPAIQTAFHVKTDQINELRPGHALIVRKNGSFSEEQVREPLERRALADRQEPFALNARGDHFVPQQGPGQVRTGVDHLLELLRLDLEIAHSGQRADRMVELAQDKHVEIAEVAGQEKADDLAAPVGQILVTTRPARDQQADDVGMIAFAGNIGAGLALTQGAQHHG
jgi:hypothetical protein